MEKYWTSRASNLWRNYDSAVGNVMDRCTVDEYLWSAANDAISCRDAEALSALLRVADERSSRSTEIRFSVAIRAMKKGYYDCAVAAWEDGGRCWDANSSDEHVPDSKTSAEVINRLCVALARTDADEETDLSTRFKNAGVV